MKILGYTSDELIALVEEGIQLLVNNCGIDRTYGYFSVFDTTEGGSFMLTAKIGFPPQEKNAKYLALSQEKALRLFSHPEHKLSFQSKNEQEGKWGGAVRGISEIFSFSGLPEQADEALMLFIAYKTGVICGRETALGLATLSENPYLALII